MALSLFKILNTQDLGNFLRLPLLPFQKTIFSDIGGYVSFCFRPIICIRRKKELLHRWMEMNAFGVIFRTHEGLKPSIAHQIDSCNETLSAFSRWSNIFKELKKYKKGDKLKVKVLEIKKEEQKVRVGLKQLGNDPFNWFKDKKVNDVITVQVVSTDNKGLTVKPEGCELEFVIKKSNIAVNASDARPSRFVGGERIDAAIAELNIDKRKASLSIKLLEELQNKEAVSKFSSPLSGKNLPFSSLSKKLDDKKSKDDE